MNQWPYFVIFFVVFGLTMYWFYCQGAVVSKSIGAVLFAFQPGKDGDRARLNSCTGWVKHVCRLHESRMYEFALDAQLTRGDAEVVLLDKNKRQLLKLNRYVPADKVELNGKGRYYLRWEFKSATGTCELHWQ